METPLTEKMEKAIEAYEESFKSWKTKWEEYHVEYVSKYDEIIAKRHTWYLKYKENLFKCE